MPTRTRFSLPLYLRAYLALLLSLLAFALVLVALWHRPDGPLAQASQVMGQLLQNALPPADAAPEAQQRALEALAQGLSASARLVDAQGQLLASVGPARAQAAAGGGLGPGALSLGLPDGRVLTAALDLHLGPSWLSLHAALLLLALSIGLAAFPIVRQLTRRLERLQQGVERLGAGDFAARVDEQGRDEVALLARQFNRAAARIEQLMAAHKVLLANASHELRTPLTRLQLTLALVKDGLDLKRRAQMEKDLVELDSLIEEILLASRLDLLSDALQLESIDLLALAAETSADFTEVHLEGTPVTLQGDARLLRRLLRNLLDNAHRHGVAPVQLRISGNAGEACIKVWDAGPGVPASESEKIFEPFYRGPGQTQGHGLGLALIRQIARRHGGTARYESMPEAQRGGFVVRLKTP
jgi:signal transduction histidine kinase